MTQKIDSNTKTNVFIFMYKADRPNRGNCWKMKAYSAAFGYCLCHSILGPVVLAIKLLWYLALQNHTFRPKPILNRSQIPHIQAVIKPYPKSKNHIHVQNVVAKWKKTEE